MRRIIFFWAIIVFHINVIAQDIAITKPVIVKPSSAEATALKRYGEIPVDYSTGVPRIEIPLLTVQSGMLEVPVSLSYHASGVKINDVASEVGLGWALNCGGMVTWLSKQQTVTGV